MKEISTQELKSLMASKKNFTLLDCRAADYFHWERLPGATNLRWKYIATANKKLLPPKESLIVTYCQSFLCPASTKAYEALAKLGYKDLLEYSGGIEDWRAHGFEILSSPDYKIATNVYRFPDQVFYGEQVGSYLIEQSDCIVLVDGPMKLTDDNEDFILNFGKPIKILLSHGATGGDSAELQKRHGAKIFLHKKDAKNEWLTVKPDVLFNHDLKLSDDLQIFHMPGHSAGSVVLLDSKNKILFAGDTLGGDAEGNVSDFYSDTHCDDIRECFESVQKMLELEFNSIFPFHELPIRVRAKESLSRFVAIKKGEI